uniref:Adhesion G protein-coupled receptor A1a n=1 Tax=Neolamprologus brichardi TaxID=32507 RepID=A0A3Q4NAQ4_NEOBR
MRTTVLSFPPYPGDYLHPVVYACTAVMLLCLLVSIMTYIVHHSAIRISRNGWHTLLNFLFHTGLTFGIFAGGINQINLPFVCQIVGIVLHYASLSTMLWLTFTARNICKDVSKDPLQAQERNRASQTFGVTAAFGMDNYGSRDDALYCWMAWEPSLGGFYAPMSLLVLVMCVYFLWTYVQLRRHPERKYELRVLSEEQQQLSSNESHHHCHADTGSAGDCQPFAAGVSVLANEHSFKSQLRATVFTLFLFLATWTLGALAVSLGHFLDMIFSCLYGAFCVTLGLFLLIQHCAKRDDVWHRWWACCPCRSKTEDGPGGGQSQRQELHQPHCHLNSPLSVKQQMLSPYPIQSSHHRTTPPSQSPALNHTGPCCVAVMTPVSPSPISPRADQMPSPRPQSLPDELPHPALPLQSCIADRTKTRSFNRPRQCFQDYRSHITSTSMDGSVHSTHLDSPHNVISSCHSLLMPSHGDDTSQWRMYCSVDDSSSTNCCERADPVTLQYEQDPGHLSFPRNTLPRQHGTVNRRGPIGRNRSLQEDSLFGSDATGNIRTGPWKNETTV